PTIYYCMKEQTAVFFTLTKERMNYDRPTYRPPSEQLVDLHIYVVPAYLWHDRLRSAFNQVIGESVSAGFVRVPPDIHLDHLRSEIEKQLGFEVVPRSFVYCKSVGRCLTQVRGHQEQEMKVKHFLPPHAYCPEIFVLDSEVARRSQTSSNGSMASNRSNNTEQSSSRSGFHKRLNQTTVYHGKAPQVTQKGGTGVYIGPYPMQSYPGLNSRPGTAGSQGQHDSGLDLDDDESERERLRRLAEEARRLAELERRRAEDEERRRREEEERRRREEEERLRRLAEEEERRRRERENENAANSLIPNLLIEEATMIHEQEPEDPQEKLRREREELLQLLQKIRDDRLEIERRREDLMRRAKQLQSRMQNLRNQARDMWKKRYFEAKKQTVPLEEQTNKLREELEAYHKRMVGTMTSRVKEGRNVDAPDATQQLNLRIQATRMQHEIEELQRRVDDSKMKLTAEVKLRTQAESELRTMKSELTQRKLNLSVTRSQQMGQNSA
ncbi:hypothetical protein BOX15_Mlig003676g2, partial [Macrostomum lignano]